MTRGGARRSLGSNGDVGNQGELPYKSSEDKSKEVTTFTRVLTVVAYIVSVSTAATLLSAYYVFFWVPQPTDPLVQHRPTDSPYSMAQHGNTHSAGSSFYHYPKNTYSVDTSKHSPPSRGSKKSNHKTTVSPSYLPKPQHLVHRKATKPTTTPSPRSRF